MGLNGTVKRTPATGLFVGLTTVDVIQLVDSPPGPDDKVIALDQVVAAGGPATNAAVAFRALGGRALLAAPVGRGPLAGLVRADLASCGVELLDCAAGASASTAGRPSVAACAVSAATGERSVVSGGARAGADPAPVRALAADPGAVPGRAPDVVLIDGHNPDLARAALDLAEGIGALTIMDAGSWKDDAADLPGRCDVVAASARFHPPGEGGAVTAPAEVASWLRSAGAAAVVITGGAAPVLWWCGDETGEVAPPRVRPVDTLGAGDVFHGALAHALAAHRPPGSAGASDRGASMAARPAARPVRGGELSRAIAGACQLAAASTTCFGTRAWLNRPPPAAPPVRPGA